MFIVIGVLLTYVIGCCIAFGWCIADDTDSDKMPIIVLLWPGVPFVKIGMWIHEMWNS